MAKLVDVNGEAVNAPNIINAINESTVAQDTVNEMQSILDKLSTSSQTFNKESSELFLELDRLEIPLETTVKLYAALKQAYLTDIFVLNSESTKQEMLINLFSAKLANLVFFKNFDNIPQDKFIDVIIIVTNIMFQIEESGDDTSESS